MAASASRPADLIAALDKGCGLADQHLESLYWWLADLAADLVALETSTIEKVAEAKQNPVEAADIHSRLAVAMGMASSIQSLVTIVFLALQERRPGEDDD